MNYDRSTEVTLKDSGNAAYPIDLKIRAGDESPSTLITPEEAAVLGRELIEASIEAALPFGAGELEVTIGIKLEVKQ